MLSLECLMLVSIFEQCMELHEGTAISQPWEHVIQMVVRAEITGGAMLGDMNSRHESCHWLSVVPQRISRQSTGEIHFAVSWTCLRSHASSPCLTMPSRLFRSLASSDRSFHRSSMILVSPRHPSFSS